MKFTKGLLFMMLFLLPLAVLGQAYNDLQSRQEENEVYPKWAAKTNLLYDAAIMTLNLGVEFKIANKMTLDIPINYNDWATNKSIFHHKGKGEELHNVQWKNLLIQPELRYWTKQPFGGHFVGLHAHYATYGVGGLWNPPFSSHMHTHRFEGWLAGAGISYGYRHNFNGKWHIEGTVGFGYAYLSYAQYPCNHCGVKEKDVLKHYIGPTKIGINLVYGLGPKATKTTKTKTAPPVRTAPVAPVEPVCPPPVIIVVPRQTPYTPQMGVSYLVPEAEAVKARAETGSAYLDYEVGRWNILPDFRNNAVELQRIHAKIREVYHDPDATITSIVITGFASPEGSYSSNLTLSHRRALSLKEHLKAVYDFNEGLFKVTGSGEDWAGLDSLVASSSMMEKYRLLEVIRSMDNPDLKEIRLRGLFGGYPYQFIKNELYPKLRRSDYRINYTVASFAVDKAKEIFKTRPGNLSLNEMYLLANTYEAGSNAFNELFEVAVQLFPNSDVANINAAANALERGDGDLALQYLNKVVDKNAAYWNNLGIIRWMQEDEYAAADCFALGGAQGALNAAEMNKHFESLQYYTTNPKNNN
ncbi:MAG: DUF3575 domain-containing protein [Bacteroidetes bacterium]|nr:DUF3575 domain-containing protein [Bacteroidota bacterium]